MFSLGNFNGHVRKSAEDFMNVHAGIKVGENVEEQLLELARIKLILKRKKLIKQQDLKPKLILCFWKKKQKHMG